jgi:hypothetical protein
VNKSCVCPCSVSDWSYIRAFHLQMQQTLLNNLKRLYIYVLVGCSVIRLHLKSLCFLTAGFSSSYQMMYLVFCAWDVIFHSCGIGTSSGQVYKLLLQVKNLIIMCNWICSVVNSFALQFISDVTLKLWTFCLCTVCCLFGMWCRVW